MNKLTFEANKANDSGSGGALYFVGLDKDWKESRVMTDGEGGAVSAGRSSAVSI